jgi:hypothetical protein
VIVFHEVGFPDYISRPPAMLKRTKKSTTRVLALLTAALQRLRLQLVVRVHLRPDEQVSETFVFVILQREKANKVFGKGFSCDCSQNFVTSRLPTRSRGAASRRHLRRANRSLPVPLIDDSDSDQDDLSYDFVNLSITVSSTSTSSRYYTCNLFFLFCLISMFDLC